MEFTFVANWISQVFPFLPKIFRGRTRHLPWTAASEQASQLAREHAAALRAVYGESVIRAGSDLVQAFLRRLGENWTTSNIWGINSNPHKAHLQNLNQDMASALWLSYVWILQNFDADRPETVAGLVDSFVMGPVNQALRDTGRVPVSGDRPLEGIWPARTVVTLLIVGALLLGFAVFSGKLSKTVSPGAA